MRAIVTQSGNIKVIELERPDPAPGHVLVRTEYSAISPGTEMGFVGRASDDAAAIGYSAVGIVEAVGEGVADRRVGERVACYGVPYVRHAEWLAVPTNLTAVVPEGVAPEEAAFGGLGAIAVHALRVADLRFGESAVVVGLGILGNLVAQIAHAAACRAVGYDLNAERADRLRQLGGASAYAEADALEAALPEETGGAGADAVLLCASGPGEPLINKALEWVRDRGEGRHRRRPDDELQPRAHVRQGSASAHLARRRPRPVRPVVRAGQPGLPARPRAMDRGTESCGVHPPAGGGANLRASAYYGRLPA
ncbi:zinc-dependent alcohol dehydrogenase [Cohnella rhizosphaerae]|uniref:zinc-dependent alcohol dehydrogenase n=1 Tax=Cohnella rhizosphaerae TaxID=1457232 RepID=UPI0030B881B2